jgi:NADH-quinone oxidoreductase subunit N
MNPQIVQDLTHFFPELAVSIAFLLVIIVDIAFSKTTGNRISFSISLLGLIASFILAIPLFGANAQSMFFGMVALDRLAVFFKYFVILASTLVLVVAPGSKELSKSHLGEFYALLLGVTLGMMLLVSAIDLLMLFLSLEMVSLSSYIMVGYLRNDRQSNEASLKYLLFGTVSTGCMLYGITLLYGITGTTRMAAIRDFVFASGFPSGNALILMVSTVLVIAGFGFKTAAVPFHFWCPDAYEGAPTPVTAFLSVAPKAAGFGALIRFFQTSFAQSFGDSSKWAALNSTHWPTLLLILSILTMTFGNIAALRQDNMKRLLAYSSIAHAGYILMGAVVSGSQGTQSMLVYLITYLFMNLGAFLIVIEVFNRTGSFSLNHYSGFFRRAPFIAIAMTIFMLSLMGIPPFAGFFGKLYVFAAAVKGNLAWFAVIGALNSVISVYYYARVIKTMIIDSNQDAGTIKVSRIGQAMIWLMLLPTAGLALFWGPIHEVTASSIQLFLGN